MPKNWCFWTVVLEKTLESLLDSKEIKAVNPKGNEHWIFIGRTDAEAPILWPPDVKNQLIGKDPGAEKFWGQEKTATEDEMTGWHYWLDGHVFERSWRRRKPGILQFMGPQRIRHNLVTEEQQQNLNYISSSASRLINDKTTFDWKRWPWRWRKSQHPETSNHHLTFLLCLLYNLSTYQLYFP